MPYSTWTRRLAFFVAVATLALGGCADTTPEMGATAKPDNPEPPQLANKVNMSQNIWLEVEGNKRRVLVSAEVCLNKGPLEQFMTRKHQKEHEAILSADIDARKLHETLLLTGAKPGTPVQHEPRFRAATGSAIKVSVRYTDSTGAMKTVSAGSWLRNPKTKKELSSPWIFAGSMLVENPFDPSAAKRYLANDGDVICVSNFETALLDLPFQSSKGDEELSYEAWTERIPEIGTKVVVVLEPVKSK